MMISSPIFAGIMVLILPISVLIGKSWLKRMRDVVWRDGANWMIWWIHENYERVPDKLNKVLLGAEHQIQSGWPLDQKPKKNK